MIIVRHLSSWTIAVAATLFSPVPILAGEGIIGRWFLPKEKPQERKAAVAEAPVQNTSLVQKRENIATDEIPETEVSNWKAVPPPPKLPTTFPPRPVIDPPEIPLGTGQVQPLPNATLRPAAPSESGEIPYVEEETPGLKPPWSTATAAEGPLALTTIIDSVEEFFPLLLAVEQQRLVTDGEVLAALGAFDFKVRAGGISNALGFYQYNQGNIGFEQQLAAGGIKLFGGHRVGVGNFPSWYGNLETYNGGEFITGAKVPLLRDRAIDKYRATLRKAAIERQIAEPEILKSRIEFIRAASVAYWDWLAAGQAYLVSRSLLNLAETRDEALKRRIEAGLTKPIERTDNQRVIVQRRAKLVASQQKFQQSAIKLSLFFRDVDGLPILPPAERLPESFPSAEPVEKRRVPNEVQFALSRRPEIQKLNLTLEKNSIDRAMARNEFLPSLDAQVYGSQDVGGPNPKKDKGPYQLEAGLFFEVPLQRRYARGNIERTDALRSQLQLELRYAQDKVLADIQNSIAAMDSAYTQVGQARETVELARIMEEAERRNLFLGNSNILFVNLRETATVDAAILEIDALSEYFRAVADYRAALAMDADDVVALDEPVPAK